MLAKTSAGKTKAGSMGTSSSNEVGRAGPSDWERRAGSGIFSSTRGAGGGYGCGRGTEVEGEAGI